MRLIGTLQEFKDGLAPLLNASKQIQTKRNDIESYEELEQLNEEIATWGNECVEFWTSNVVESKHKFQSDFPYRRRPRHRTRVKDTFIRKKVDESLNELKSMVHSLVYHQRILEQSDVAINPLDDDLFERRKDLTTDQKLGLLLEKLFNLYDGFYYPISLILYGNGVPLSRLGEDRELGKLLEDSGYVKLMHSLETLAQLTIEGKRFVENQLLARTQSYDQVPQDQQDLNDRIDEVIERLTKLGYGQEILFEELEELKELHAKLSKKAWGQVLKGKLIDLGLEKVLDSDAMELAYKKLTETNLELPS